MRVRTHTPGWLTVVIAPFARCAHGNVMPDDCVGPRPKPYRPPMGSTLVRLVGYTPGGVAKFVRRVKAVCGVCILGSQRAESREHKGLEASSELY